MATTLKLLATPTAMNICKFSVLIKYPTTDQLKPLGVAEQLIIHVQQLLTLAMRGLMVPQRDQGF